MENLVVLSLGSNVGDRGKSLKEAVKRIETKFDIKLKKSHMYDAPPLFFEDQANFYNCVVTFRTEINPLEILDITSGIEHELGRRREKEIPKGPRTIDIDIVFVGDIITSGDRLTVPHPGLQDRLFVLKPLAELYPEFVHPAVGITIREMIEMCPDKSIIQRVDDFWK